MSQQQLNYLQRPSSTPAGSLTGGGLAGGIPRPRTGISSYDWDANRVLAASKAMGGISTAGGPTVSGSPKNRSGQSPRFSKRASSASDPIASLRNGGSRAISSSMDIYGGAGAGSLLNSFGATGQRRGLTRNPSSGALSSDAPLQGQALYRASSLPSSPQRAQLQTDATAAGGSVSLRERMAALQRHGRSSSARSRASEEGFMGGFTSAGAPAAGAAAAASGSELASLRARVAELEAALRASQQAHALTHSAASHASPAPHTPTQSATGAAVAVAGAAHVSQSSLQGHSSHTNHTHTSGLTPAPARAPGADVHPGTAAGAAGGMGLGSQRASSPVPGASDDTPWPAHHSPPALPVGGALVHSGGSAPASGPLSHPTSSSPSRAHNRSEGTSSNTPGLTSSHTSGGGKEVGGVGNGRLSIEPPTSPRTPLTDHDSSPRSSSSSLSTSPLPVTAGTVPAGAVSGSAPVTPDLPLTHRVGTTPEAASRRRSSNGGMASLPPPKPVCVSIGVQADMPQPLGATSAAAAPSPPPTPPLPNSGGPRPTSAAGPITACSGGRGRPMSAAALAAAAAAATSAAATAELERKVAVLGAQLRQAKATAQFLAGELAEAESVSKEAEAGRREYAARYAFCLLDEDGDGYVHAGQVCAYDSFAPYPRSLLDTALGSWRYASGHDRYLTADDFLRFVSLAEERGTRRDAQRFWFRVLDTDGDGRLGRADARAAYDAIAAMRAPGDPGFLVSFEDLWAQLLDMVGCTRSADGFTAAELWASKLGGGVLGLLTNHGNMTLARSTAEWGRGNWPL